MSKTKTSKEDDQILTLLGRVKSQKEKIERAEKPKWLTNCMFVYEGRTINLHTVNCVRELVKYAGRVLAVEAEIKLGLDVLSVPHEPVLYNGFPTEQWISDFRTRMSKIQVIQEKKKLEDLEARLDKLVSPEKRRELELQAIINELE